MSSDLESVFCDAASIPAPWRPGAVFCQREYLVDGALRRWEGPVQDVESPIRLRGKAGGYERVILGETPLLTAKESLEALDAAARAYDNGRGLWPTMPVADRIRRIEEFAERMKAKRNEIVRLIVWEIAKTVPDAEKEFDRTIQYIADTVEALKELDRASAHFTVTEGIIAQIRRAPLGVVLCMGPYNYPLNETFTILIPALIMGNTIVFKPPKIGVLLHQPLLEIYRDVFPPGVVNAIYGDGETIIGPLMDSGRVDVLGFIGSTRVADSLKERHPKPHRLRAVLGLGAKNAAIVLPDADLELAVRECVLGGLSYNGQRCTALKIMFVHRSIADEFLSRMGRAVDSLGVGLPWGESQGGVSVSITPLPGPGKAEHMGDLVADACSQGANVINARGGRRCETIFSPTVVCPVAPGMRLYHEEQFGPVVPIAPFDDVRAPIEWVEQSRYGQQVSLFGEDPDLLARLIDPLVNQVCRVNINSQCQRGPDVFPFTGRKDSAEGTLSVPDALRAFSIRTLVAAKQNETNRRVLRTILREHKSSFLSTDFIF